MIHSLCRPRQLQHWNIRENIGAPMNIGKNIGAPMNIGKNIGAPMNIGKNIEAPTYQLFSCFKIPIVLELR
ncbi:hypothetical protein BDN72DRAFT_847847, partial [Pluteus cervinus]